MAGGKNLRMEGNKKAYLEYRGKYFYECIAESMAALGKIYISVENKAFYPGMIYPQIEDIYPEIGPLGGICSAFQTVAEDAFMILPCDVPKVTGAFVDAVIARWQQEGRPVIVKAGEKLHPLIGIYERRMLPVIEAMIRRGDYRMSHLIAKTQTAAVDIRELNCSEEILLNVNNAEQLNKL